MDMTKLVDVLGLDSDNIRIMRVRVPLSIKSLVLSF